MPDPHPDRAGDGQGKRIPGPPNPPMVPGHMGTPSREQLDAMAATFSVFDWLEANGLMRGEVKRLHNAFMWEYGPDAQRWLDQQGDPPPSWQQMADLLRDKQAAEQEAEDYRAGLRHIKALAAIFKPGDDPKGIEDYADSVLARATTPASGKESTAYTEQSSSPIPRKTAEEIAEGGISLNEVVIGDPFPTQKDSGDGG